MGRNILIKTAPRGSFRTLFSGRPYLFVLLVGYSLLSRSVVMSQARVDCEEKRDYLSSCAGLRTDQSCSREMTDLCCGCQDAWKISLAYCTFQQALFPTPIPINTGTATVTVVPTLTAQPTLTFSPCTTLGSCQTPVATFIPQPTTAPTSVGQDPPEIPSVPECSLTVSGQSCSAGRNGFQVVVDSAHRSEFRYDWKISCYDSNGREDLETESGFVPEIRDNGAVLAVSMNTPQLSTEIICKAGLQVTRVDTSTTACSTSVLVASCDLGCTSTDVKSTLITLDGAAATQKRLALKGIKILDKAGLKRSIVKRDKAEATALYAAAWRAAWEMPALTVHCENALLCSTAALESQQDQYRGALSKSVHLVKRITGRRAPKLSAKLKRNLKGVWKVSRRDQEEALKVLEMLPKTSSSCVASSEIRYAAPPVVH